MKYAYLLTAILTYLSPCLHRFIYLSLNGTYIEYGPFLAKSTFVNIKNTVDFCSLLYKRMCHLHVSSVNQYLFLYLRSKNIYVLWKKTVKITRRYIFMKPINYNWVISYMMHIVLKNKKKFCCSFSDKNILVSWIQRVCNFFIHVVIHN